MQPSPTPVNSRRASIEDRAEWRSTYRELDDVVVPDDGETLD